MDCKFQLIASHALVAHAALLVLFKIPGATLNPGGLPMMTVTTYVALLGAALIVDRPSFAVSLQDSWLWASYFLLVAHFLYIHSCCRKSGHGGSEPANGENAAAQLQRSSEVPGSCPNVSLHVRSIL